MDNERSRKVTPLQSQYMQQQERQDQIQKRRRRGLIRRLTLLGAIAAAAAVFIIFTFVSQSIEIGKKAEEKDKLASQLTELKKDQKMLQQEIKNLNDDEYIAKIARRDYFLSGKDEIIFNVPDKK
ncbi:septum formation initiator family protein [Metabacillus sp. GX 13764]|uniref:FtsB family cell division protein n=1 Tax=Metabacillus kandeliae TaxID=2900151 RepID=UPI001E44C33D|nr:septum formation initiator family protein [Metabacillus kandeliae]MCD7036656.1 septum formation initiator family protein [Metabacillus kandeliae]